MGSAALRADYPLIRFLSQTYDPLVGRAWQDLPSIQMPREALLVRPRGGEELLGVQELPFDDFVLDCDAHGLVDDGIERVSLLHYWFRVSTAAAFLARQHRDRPWWNGRSLRAGFSTAPLDGPDKTVVIETWVAYPTNGFLPSPETTAVHVRYGQALIFRTQQDRLGYERSTAREQRLLQAEHERHTNMCRVLLYYLATTLDYLVQECPQTAPVRRPSAKDKKPWTWTHLPRVVLLPPQQTGGAASGAPPHEPGTHASPRPHQRRAHWRTLHHPRYGTRQGQRIRVRPAWVGPPEWVLNGTVYKVVDPAPQRPWAALRRTDAGRVLLFGEGGER